MGLRLPRPLRRLRVELSDPSWAGTTAALVCQPQLGASMRKATFRLIGTAIGGVAIV